MKILRLKEILKEKGVTSKELAFRTDVTENAISMIINNKRQPRFELLVKISTTLDIDIKDLFISTKPQKNPKEIIQTIKNSIEDLEALYETIDKRS